MAHEWQNDSTLPAPVRDGLTRLCNQLQQALGERLVSVILHGGLARGEYAPQSSDVNVMLVLQQATVEELDQAISPVQQCMRDLRLAVMVVTEDGLLRSTDVFPIKFLDMQKHHRVLVGKDVLTDLAITNAHLRLRCEQEIKNLLYRLRHFYLQRGSRPELVEATLGTAVSAFLKSLSALLTLKIGHAPTAKSAIAEAVVRELDLDGRPLHDALALKSGTYKPDSAELRDLYGRFMATVQKAADIVDRF